MPPNGPALTSAVLDRATDGVTSPAQVMTTMAAMPAAMVCRGTLGGTVVMVLPEIY